MEDAAAGIFNLCTIYSLASWAPCIRSVLFTLYLAVSLSLYKFYKQRQKEVIDMTSWMEEAIARFLLHILCLRVFCLYDYYYWHWLSVSVHLPMCGIADILNAMRCIHTFLTEDARWIYTPAEKWTKERPKHTNFAGSEPVHNCWVMVMFFVLLLAGAAFATFCLTCCCYCSIVELVFTEPECLMVLWSSSK